MERRGEDAQGGPLHRKARSRDFSMATGVWLLVLLSDGVS
jgi:hypothetical protein